MCEDEDKKLARLEVLGDVLEAVTDLADAVEPVMVSGGPDDHGIQRVAWGMLGEWWCIPTNVDEDVAAQVIMDTSQIGMIDGMSLDLVKDRLYGGFYCPEHDTHRHVYYATGEYTYLGTNVANDCRDESWAKVIKENPPGESGGFIGGGLFCLDAPGRIT
jgi:hypothetical protein